MSSTGSILNLSTSCTESDGCIDIAVIGASCGNWSDCFGDRELSTTTLSASEQMEVIGKSIPTGPANVIFLSSILGRDGPVSCHKCNWKCENENVCGNMFHCKLTGATHICDKNCNQRILYDNQSSLCRVSGLRFPLSPAELQAVRGVRRKFDADNSPTDSCAPKRRCDAQFHTSPFERSFCAVVGPVYSPVGDSMDMS